MTSEIYQREPVEWQESSLLHDSLLYLTASELTALKQELLALAAGYQARTLEPGLRCRFEAGRLLPSTSALALELVQREELDLDGDIRERLVSWRLPAGAGPVTLRELLGHTAGVNVPFCPGYSQSATPADLACFVHALQAAAPGDGGRLTPETAWQ